MAATAFQKAALARPKAAETLAIRNIRMRVSVRSGSHAMAAQSRRCRDHLSAPGLSRRAAMQWERARRTYGLSKRSVDAVTGETPERQERQVSEQRNQ